MVLRWQKGGSGQKHGVVPGWLQRPAVYDPSARSGPFGGVGIISKEKIIHMYIYIYIDIHMSLIPNGCIEIEK